MKQPLHHLGNRHQNATVVLISIDHEYQAGGSTPPGTLLLKTAEKAVVEGVVRNVLPGMDKFEQERLARFAAGFPQAARLIAESWEASLVAVSNDALIDRVLLGRRPADKDQLRKAGMLLSVFGLVGVKAPLDTDIEKVAALPGAPEPHELRSSFDDLLRRGVAQARGRLISLQPPPVTLPLAQRQWRQWDRKTWDYVLAFLPGVHLRIRAARQLTLLNREDLALEIAREVCRPDGPFGSVEKLGQDGATEVLSLLAEIDARVVAKLLESVLDQLDLHQIKEIDGYTRRHLVWALEKIAFCEDTFEQGARLLLALAVAENEECGNNATSAFQNLFTVLGGSTAAGPEARMQMLDEVLSAGEDRFILMVVEALLKGADTRGSFRVLALQLHSA